MRLEHPDFIQFAERFGAKGLKATQKADLPGQRKNSLR